MHADRIWRNARLATFKPQPGASNDGVGAVERGLVAAAAGRILYCGEESRAPEFSPTAERIDCEGRWITPGLIDCHTHLVYAGDRAAEFEQRLAGVTYEAIARAGGGIAASVRATRAASEEQLIAATLPRLDALLAEGLTTIEIKSGYGLEWPTERRMLLAAGALAARRRVRVARTFLGAHALPPGFAGDADAYVEQLCEDMIPRVAQEKLAEIVDAYCERIAFSPAQVARLFAVAKQHGLGVKLHADQLSDLGGAALAAQFKALSADHLEYTNEAGVAALAAAGTTAVLLPAAFYFLRETRLPPVDLLRQHRVPIAVATDSNPGTAPITSLLLAMNMAATCFRLTVDECLAGVTREAARALGLLNEIGTLEVGKWCDLAVWDIDRPAELVYRLGFNPLHARVWRGQ